MSALTPKQDEAAFNHAKEHILEAIAEAIGEEHHNASITIQTENGPADVYDAVMGHMDRIEDEVKLMFVAAPEERETLQRVYALGRRLVQAANVNGAVTVDHLKEMGDLVGIPLDLGLL